jgi:hypothetical protein
MASTELDEKMIILNLGLRWQDMKLVVTIAL